MATNFPMSHAAPVAAPGEQLPTVSDVKEWTAKELFNFIQSQNTLPNDKNLTKFQNAEVGGEVFLKAGEVADFWLHTCQLQPGPSAKLALLVKRIKGVGKEQSQGNASCFSDVAGTV
jgi:hypothetical protein